MLDFDFEPQTPSWAKRLAAFDLETTGLDLRQSRIVTACVAVLNANGEVEELHEWLVDPGIEIPEAASNVHGVTTEIARANGAPPAAAVPELVSLLAGLMDQMPLVAFNAAYDFSILHHEALRNASSPLTPKPVVDPMVLDKQLVRFRKGKRTLSALTLDYQVPLENAHNSTADAIAAGRLAQRMARQFADQLSMDANELHELQIGWAKEQALDFEKWMKTQNRPDFRAELGWPVRD
ncbi:MAG: 3'-5' exonuclease [Actinobacteria bacterium]|nr:3'-5' exonuclease [Actinomycetota bacterium]